MRVALAGTIESSARFEPVLERAGIEVERLEAGAGASGGSQIAALAASLMAIDARLAASEPAAVVLGDDSDLALAAALVATKLQIPVIATNPAANPAAGGEEGLAAANGGLIARLADRIAGPDPEALVAAIGAASEAARPGDALPRA